MRKYTLTLRDLKGILEDFNDERLLDEPVYIKGANSKGAELIGPSLVLPRYDSSQSMAEVGSMAYCVIPWGGRDNTPSSEGQI